MYNAVRPVNMRKFGKVKGRKYSAVRPLWQHMFV